MSRENQSPWPARRESGTELRSPTAFFATSDGYLKSERPLAGPLRLGTSPPVGPKGGAGRGSSDFGMDRITPRGFDPAGTALDRYGAQESSPLVSRELRATNRRKE